LSVGFGVMKWGGKRPLAVAFWRDEMGWKTAVVHDVE